MKKVFLTCLLTSLLVCSASAAEERNVVGGKFEAPSIVKFNDAWSAGIEVGKNVFSDAFFSGAEAFEDDKGYFGYVTVTYSGSWFDFSKDE